MGVRKVGRHRKAKRVQNSLCTVHHQAQYGLGNALHQNVFSVHVTLTVLPRNDTQVLVQTEVYHQPRLVVAVKYVEKGRKGIKKKSRSTTD